MRIRVGKLAHEAPGTIARAVIDEYDLVVAYLLTDCGDATMKLSQPDLFIEAWYDHGKFESSWTYCRQP